MKSFSNSRLAQRVGAADAFDNWLAPARARWRVLGERERRGIVVAAWLVVLLLLWFVALGPAWRVTRAAPAQLDRLDGQLQLMQRQAGEARELRALPALGNAQSAAALRAATEALGTAARLQVNGDRATLTLLTGIDGEQLRDWLAEARSAARARPLEANLVRGALGYTGSVVVALPAANTP